MEVRDQYSALGQCLLARLALARRGLRRAEGKLRRIPIPRPVPMGKNLHDVVKAKHMAAAESAFAGDRADFPGAVVVVHLRIELALDFLAHEVAKRLGGRIHELRTVEADVVFACDLCQPIQRTRVAGHVVGALAPDEVDEVEPYLIRRREKRVQEGLVAPEDGWMASLRPALPVTPQVAFASPQPDVLHIVHVHPEELPEIEALGGVGPARIVRVLGQHHGFPGGAARRVPVGVRELPSSVQGCEIVAQMLLGQHGKLVQNPVRGKIAPVIRQASRERAPVVLVVVADRLEEVRQQRRGHGCGGRRSTSARSDGSSRGRSAVRAVEGRCGT